jgi:hypothetical protein
LMLLSSAAHGAGLAIIAFFRSIPDFATST